MVNEALRRLRNTSRILGPEVQNSHLSDFMFKLKNSGYTKKFRVEVLMSAKAAYKKQVENENLGLKPLYRNRSQILIDRAKKKNQKYNWFKGKGHQNFTSVLFVPPTPGSKLAKMIQEREAELNKNSKGRIKVVEQGGQKLKNILSKKNPFPTLDCVRRFCPFCRDTEYSVAAIKKPMRKSCSTPNVGYEIVCQNCKENGLNAVYYGESGRPVVNRAKEHLTDLQTNNKASPLVKHKKLKHSGGQKVTFEFQIKKKFFDPLTRQCEEGMRINKAKNIPATIVLNSKSEFNHPPTNRVVIQKRNSTPSDTIISGIKCSIGRKRISGDSENL